MATSGAKSIFALERSTGTSRSLGSPGGCGMLNAKSLSLFSVLKASMLASSAVRPGGGGAKGEALGQQTRASQGQLRSVQQLTLAGRPLVRGLGLLRLLVAPAHRKRVCSSDAQARARERERERENLITAPNRSGVGEYKGDPELESAIVREAKRRSGTTGRVRVALISPDVSPARALVIPSAAASERSRTKRVNRCARALCFPFRGD